MVPNFWDQEPRLEGPKTRPRPWLSVARPRRRPRIESRELHHWFKLISFLHLYLFFCNFLTNKRWIRRLLKQNITPNVYQIYHSVTKLQTFSVWHKYDIVQMQILPICNALVHSITSSVSKYSVATILEFYFDFNFLIVICMSICTGVPNFSQIAVIVNFTENCDFLHRVILCGQYLSAYQIAWKFLYSWPRYGKKPK